MDKRISKMQELLVNTMGRIQALHLQATASNIASLYEALANIQTVQNTLGIILKEQQEENEDGREADTQ